MATLRRRLPTARTPLCFPFSLCPSCFPIQPSGGGPLSIPPTLLLNPLLLPPKPSSLLHTQRPPPHYCCSSHEATTAPISPAAAIFPGRLYVLLPALPRKPASLQSRPQSRGIVVQHPVVGAASCLLFANHSVYHVHFSRRNDRGLWIHRSYL